MVTNESPQTLAGMFTEYFDRIMVDAPCSGEGMFRKMSRHVRSGVLKCSGLCGAAAGNSCMCGLHAPAGRTYGLLYLYLCTGGKRGNDQPFSGTASAVSYCAGEKYPGMADGVAAWTKHPAAEIGDTIRLFPHHLHGEGHFVAVLEKRELFRKLPGILCEWRRKPLAKGEAKAYLAGLQEFLGKIPADDAERLLLLESSCI